MNFPAEYASNEWISAFAAIGFLAVLVVIRLAMAFIKQIIAALLFGAVAFGVLKSKSARDGERIPDIVERRF